MANAVIIGTGSHLPNKVLSNFDLEKMVNTTDEWIKTRTGISERRLVANGTSTSDLVIPAAKAALESAGISALSLDLILLATVTPDVVFPATACLIQHKLGAKNAVAFDLNAACSGFLYALKTAEQYIKADTYKNVLVIGAETMSRLIDWRDRGTCVLFGDGAGAVVLQSGKNNGRGIIDTQLYVDGSFYELLSVPAGGSRLPTSHQTIDDNLHYIRMKGNEVFKIAVRNLAQSAREALKNNKLSVDDIDLFVPHQANIRIIQAMANALSFPMEKVYTNIEKYGNTSAASIPVALDEAVRKGRLKKGDLVLLSAFGGGLTWATSLVRW